MANEVMVLKGTEMKCPKCGTKDRIGRNESVLCTTPVEVNPDGTWFWSDRETKIHWDTSEQNESEPEWWCGNCNIPFEAPEVTSQYDAKDCKWDHGFEVKEKASA